MKKVLISFATLVIALNLVNCGGSKKPATEPTPAPKPEAPAIESYRPNVPKDPNIYKAFKVIKHYGKLSKRYTPYSKIKSAGGSGTVQAMGSDMFYDTYSLPMNEKNYWVTVNYNTAERAIENDTRIKQEMKNIPVNNIDMVVKTPKGRKYVISDTEADGILDFAAPAGKPVKMSAEQKKSLLDRMQRKYSWFLRLIKKNYRHLRK